MEKLFSLAFLVHDFLAAPWTILILFKLSSDILAVFVCCVILAFAICTLQCDDFYGCLFLAAHI